MLDNDDQLLSQYGLSDGSYVHVVVTSNRGGATGQESRHLPRPTHVISSSQDVVNYRGFDRLTLIGLSINETAALRSSFNTQVDEYIRQNNHQARDEEDTSSFRYRMEEEWMARQRATSEFAMNLPTQRSSAHPLQAYTFSSERRRGLVGGGGGDLTIERPSNPGTMNDFFWGFAMG